MQTKRLCKSSTDSIISGVCGGIAEYFCIDPFIVRLIFVLTSSCIIYFILALALPYNDPILNDFKSRYR